MPSDRGRSAPTVSSRGAWHRTWRREDGNTLLLAPVGVLILLVLGAVTVDFTAIHAAQRELANLTAGLANDAASAVDEVAFFDAGEYRIDGDRAAHVVRTVLATRPDDALRISCQPPTLERPTVVRVSCVGTIELIFSQALPGRLSPYTVRASSTARAAESRP